MPSVKTPRLPAERGLGAAENGGDGAGAEPRKDFVSFRQRLERLVASLVALRSLPTSPEMWDTRPETVEVTLEAEEVRVAFKVLTLSWETIGEVTYLFQRTFAGSAPLLVDTATSRYITFAKAREKEGSANATEAMDKAVLDRFDVRVAFELPDLEQRQLALAYYARHLAPADVADLAARMEGWSFRRLSRFAESVVRAYVSGLDLSQLEASAPPLPRREDYEREIDGEARAGSQRHA